MSASPSMSMSCLTHLSLLLPVLSCVVLHTITALPLDAGSSTPPTPFNTLQSIDDVSTDATDVPVTQTTQAPVTTPPPTTTPPPEIIPDQAVGNEPTKSLEELTEKYVPETANHYVRVIPRHFVHHPHLPVHHVLPPPPVLLPSLNHYFMGNPFGRHLPKIYVRVPKGGHYWNPIRSKLYELDPNVGNYLEPMFRRSEIPKPKTDTVAENQLHTIDTQPGTWLWGDGEKSGQLVV